MHVFGKSIKYCIQMLDRKVTNSALGVRLNLNSWTFWPFAFVQHHCFFRVGNISAFLLRYASRRFSFCLSSATDVTYTFETIFDGLFCSLLILYHWSLELTLQFASYAWHLHVFSLVQ